MQPAEMAGYRFETPAMVDDMLEHLETTPGRAAAAAVRGGASCGSARDPRAQAADRAELRRAGRHRRRAREPRRPRAQRAGRRVAARWRGRCSCGWSRPSARARSCARSTSCASCRRDRTEAAAPGRSAGRGAPAGRADRRRRRRRDRRDRPRVADRTAGRRCAAGSTRARRTACSSSSCARPRASGRPKNRDAGLLWRGETVDEAARFQRRYRGELPELVRAFSKAVFDRQARSAPRRRRRRGDGRRLPGRSPGGGGVALFVIQQPRRWRPSRTPRPRARRRPEAQRRLQEVESKERERQQRRGRAERGGTKQVVTAKKQGGDDQRGAGGQRTSSSSSRAGKDARSKSQLRRRAHSCAAEQTSATRATPRSARAWRSSRPNNC